MKKLLIGTSNDAKIAEYKKLLKDYNFEIVTSKELGIAAPQETGKTFEETAIAKAKHYFEETGIPTIVDDGGLEIEALNGEPGIKNRRWIGREMTDDEIIKEVMKRMKDIPEGHRDCRHVILLAVASPLGVFTAHGYIEGIIPEKPSKKRIPGFPYKSLIYLPNYHEFWSDISPEEDEFLNHRKSALEKIKDIIQDLGK